ncbi:32073_t:CDS:2, partial [Racocetra persica]
MPSKKASKKETVSAGKKALTSSDKNNIALIENKKTYNDQNKIYKSHDPVKSFNYNDINKSRHSRSRLPSSQSRDSLSRYSCTHSRHSSLQCSYSQYSSLQCSYSQHFSLQ